MIYTITTNPSLDYYMTFEEEVSDKNYYRSILEVFDAGGKGVNVSISLSNLGMSSSALGFLGGFTRERYLESIKQFREIQPLFTTIKDCTRINVKIMTNEETSLNAKGPTITNEEFDKFKSRLSKVYDSDIVVLSGNIQEELKERIIDVVKELITNGTKVILDTSEDVVEKCLQYKPFLVRIDDRKASNDENSIVSYAKELISKGALNVAYSSGTNMNYYFVTSNEVLKATRDEELPIIIGLNDSFVAGIVYGIVRGANSKEIFQLGVASSIKLNLSYLDSEKVPIMNFFEEIDVTTL